MANLNLQPCKVFQHTAFKAIEPRQGSIIPTLFLQPLGLVRFIIFACQDHQSAAAALPYTIHTAAGNVADAALIIASVAQAKPLSQT